MHGSVHPREVGAPHGPRVARDSAQKQLLDHDIIRLVCYIIIMHVSRADFQFLN